MARVTGLEPAASGVTGRRSNQLSYAPGHDERSVYFTPYAPVKRRPDRPLAATQPTPVGDDGIEPPTLSV